jgi:ectoine hydroxylase-related dioxygenase (phytanoyl-CoA dioxygenase family)
LQLIAQWRTAYRLNDMMAHAEWMRQLEEHGFAIVPKVLALSVVVALTEQLEAHSGYAMRHLAQVVPAVNEMADSPAVRALVEPVLGSKAFLARSIFFDKTPEANWKVMWHQDLTIAVQRKIGVAGFKAWSVKEKIVHVQPPDPILERMLTVRLHLDDCDASNGALQVIAGSHQSGKLDAEAIARCRKERQPTVCAVPRGGAVLMRPLLLHASSAAHVPKHRRVIHLEFAAELLPGRLKWASCGERI